MNLLRVAWGLFLLTSWFWLALAVAWAWEAFDHWAAQQKAQREGHFWRNLLGDVDT